MYDLLLKNAWVVDPLNSVNGVADVAKLFSPALLTATFTSAKCGALPSARECWP